VDQLTDHADSRLVNGCIYCGGPEETRDHVPSRVLLEPPYPENLPVVWACANCNQGFSRDEEYFACLIEAVIAGSSDPVHIKRPGIARILHRADSLRARLEAARTMDREEVRFEIEPDRIKNVLLKLALGHAAYELSQTCRGYASTVRWAAVGSMHSDERESFETPYGMGLIGEIGSRQSQRQLITQVLLRSHDGVERIMGFVTNDWIDVQEDCYRYMASDDGDSIRVKMVIREYLACEVVWSC
jgi:hypothetical protein